MTFDTFIAAAWNDHGDHPEAVAQRLAASLDLVADTPQVVPYARLVTHVYGEHLAQWPQGVALLDRIAALPAAGGATERAALARQRAALRYAAGEPDALAGLGGEDRIVAVATAASAFAALNRFRDAIDAYESALALAAPGLPDGSPAVRALAVGGNNLAASLEEKTERDARETAGMLVAAQNGLVYWRRAGTWLEEERAQYRLARSRLAAGQPAAAAEAAQACVDVCVAHDAPAFERFFGYAALAVALRAAGRADADAKARALACHGQVPEAERHWCAKDRAELDA
ncbi:MAG: hypothetical protein U1F10_07795 [Burkholderiales bacterium]